MDVIIDKTIFAELEQRAEIEYTTITRIVTQAVIEYLQNHKG